MSKTKVEETEDKFGLDRIVFFSDAVIAIAITLLVIELNPPEIEAELVDAQLAQQVLAMWPKYLGFLVSFWVIAVYWVAHHRMFRFIADYDRRLMYINLFFLMCIAFMPYTTALLFDYPARLISVGLYAGLATVIGAALLWIWSYANRAQLVAEAVTQSMTASLTRNLLITPVVFLISIGIAFVNPLWAMYSWIILLPIYLIFRIGQ